MVYKSHYSRHLEELRKKRDAKTSPMKSRPGKSRSNTQAESFIRDRRKKYTEVYILKLLRTKPQKLKDIGEAERIASELQSFSLSLIDTSDKSIRKGWCQYGIQYGMTTRQIAKVHLLIEDLQEQICRLKQEKHLKDHETRKSIAVAKKFSRKAQDAQLAAALWTALKKTRLSTGYIYFKRWSLPDSSRWFKIGVTNNPDRRESEQNVLPVPAETIVCVDVGSMDKARSIEKIMHDVLGEQRITDARNKELFHLTDAQASSVKIVLEKLGEKITPQADRSNTFRQKA